MKKARSYCGLMYAVGIILMAIGILQLVVYNVSIIYIFQQLEGIKIALLFILGSVFLFVGYVLSKIIDHIEVQFLELRDRTIDLDIKINNQKRKN